MRPVKPIHFEMRPAKRPDQVRLLHLETMQATRSDRVRPFHFETMQTKRPDRVRPFHFETMQTRRSDRVRGFMCDVTHVRSRARNRLQSTKLNRRSVSNRINLTSDPRYTWLPRSAPAPPGTMMEMDASVFCCLCFQVSSLCFGGNGGVVWDTRI